MWRLIQILTIAVLVNCSYYSFNFAFWASGPNTKMILALFGLLWFLYDSWRGGKGVSIRAYSLVELSFQFYIR